MKNYDELVEINHKPYWSYISDHPYMILIISSSGSSTTNLSLSLIKYQQPDIDKIYLHASDPFETKYQSLINRKKT